MNLTERIDAEYDRESGFLGKLRSGQFDADGGARLLTALDELPVSDDPLEPRLVSLLWYMPLFISWQEERVPEGHRRSLRNLQNAVVSRLETVLGVP